MDASNIESLSQKEIDKLRDELEYDYPLVSSVPMRWCSWERRPRGLPLKEHWEWNATYIMFILAANDALDIPE